MIHVQQAGNECAVAALATAAGFDYEALRRTKTGTYWRSYHTDRPSWEVPGNQDPDKDWRQALDELAARVGIDMSDLAPNREDHSIGPIDGRKLRGKRGVIYLKWRDASAHMVAFDGCTIYDSVSQAYGPLPISEWRKQSLEVEY